MEYKYACSNKITRGRMTTCSICSADIDEDAGDIVGFFGISPVAFCVWCYSSIIDMANQHTMCKCEEE